MVVKKNGWLSFWSERRLGRDHKRIHCVRNNRSSQRTVVSGTSGRCRHEDSVSGYLERCVSYSHIEGDRTTTSRSYIHFIPGNLVLGFCTIFECDIEERICAFDVFSVGMDRFLCIQEESLMSKIDSQKCHIFLIMLSHRVEHGAVSSEHNHHAIMEIFYDGLEFFTRKKIPNLRGISSSVIIMNENVRV